MYKDKLIIIEADRGGFMIVIDTAEGFFPLNKVLYKTEAEAKTEVVKAEAFAHAIWNWGEFWKIKLTKRC